MSARPMGEIVVEGERAETVRHLDGRVALVCGATGRIGAAVAQALAGIGASVAVHYRDARERAEALARELAAAGRPSAPFRARLERRDEARMLLRDVRRGLGEVAVVVNAAYPPFEPKCLAEMDDVDWQPHLNAIRIHTNICAEAIPQMRRLGFGRIILISGALADRHFACFGGYSLAKAGLNAASRTAALEEGPNGIGVNIVAPGRVGDFGELIDEHVAYQRLDAVSAPWRVLGRVPSAEEVASCIVFLVSPAGRQLTGQTLYLTGGEPVR